MGKGLTTPTLWVVPQVTVATDAGNHTASINGSYNFCNQQVYATNGVLLPAASYAQTPETYLSGVPLDRRHASALRRGITGSQNTIMHAASYALEARACTAFLFPMLRAPPCGSTADIAALNKALSAPVAPAPAPAPASALMPPPTTGAVVCF